jgi:hypothetical protein
MARLLKGSTFLSSFFVDAAPTTEKGQRWQIGWRTVDAVEAKRLSELARELKPHRGTTFVQSLGASRAARSRSRI